MNYGKRGTSKKQKSVNSKAAKVSKKASVLFIKAFLVCMLAAGVVVAMEAVDRIREREQSRYLVDEDFED